MSSSLSSCRPSSPSSLCSSFRCPLAHHLVDHLAPPLVIVGATSLDIDFLEMISLVNFCTSISSYSRWVQPQDGANSLRKRKRTGSSSEWQSSTDSLTPLKVDQNDNTEIQGRINALLMSCALTVIVTNQPLWIPTTFHAFIIIYYRLSKVG